MKKFLPKTKVTHQGFTLIELLVVIAIIAILAVMGFAAFGGLTSRGNDDRRIVDIKAIGDAYEVKRTPAMADYAGEVLAGTDFAGGVIPSDPVTGRQYCIKTGTAAIANAVVGATDITAVGACGTAWTSVNGVSYTIPASQTFFKVCVLKSGNTTADIVCVGSKQ